MQEDLPNNMGGNIPQAGGSERDPCGKQAEQGMHTLYPCSALGCACD